MTKTYCDYITKAKALKKEGKISISYLQRKLKINAYIAQLIISEIAEQTDKEKPPGS